MPKHRPKFWMQIPLVRWAIFALGLVFMAAAPIVAPLPGPAGLLSFALGLGLVLQSSAWARRQYVIFKRRYPKSGHWVDWGLRRSSHKRRLARKKRVKDD